MLVILLIVFSVSSFATERDSIWVVIDSITLAPDFSFRDTDLVVVGPFNSASVISATFELDRHLVPEQDSDMRWEQPSFVTLREKHGKLEGLKYSYALMVAGRGELRTVQLLLDDKGGKLHIQLPESGLDTLHVQHLRLLHNGFADTLEELTTYYTYHKGETTMHHRETSRQISGKDNGTVPEYAITMNGTNFDVPIVAVHKVKSHASMGCQKKKSIFGRSNRRKHISVSSVAYLRQTKYEGEIDLRKN